MTKAQSHLCRERHKRGYCCCIAIEWRLFVVIYAERHDVRARSQEAIPRKQAEALLFCKNELLDQLAENLRQTVNTLSKRFIHYLL